MDSSHPYKLSFLSPPSHLFALTRSVISISSLSPLHPDKACHFYILPLIPSPWQGLSFLSPLSHPFILMRSVISISSLSSLHPGKACHFHLFPLTLSTWHGLSSPLSHLFTLTKSLVSSVSFLHPDKVCHFYLLPSSWQGLSSPSSHPFILTWSVISISSLSSLHPDKACHSCLLPLTLSPWQGLSFLSRKRRKTKRLLRLLKNVSVLIFRRRIGVLAFHLCGQ